MFFFVCTYRCHAPPTPDQAEVGIRRDLQELFDKFPTPRPAGDDFMLQIPYKSTIIPLVAMRWGNAKILFELWFEIIMEEKIVTSLVLVHLKL